MWQQHVKRQTTSAGLVGEDIERTAAAQAAPHTVCHAALQVMLAGTGSAPPLRKSVGNSTRNTLITVYPSSHPKSCGRGRQNPRRALQLPPFLTVLYAIASPAKGTVHNRQLFPSLISKPRQMVVHWNVSLGTVLSSGPACNRQTVAKRRTEALPAHPLLNLPLPPLKT